MVRLRDGGAMAIDLNDGAQCAVQTENPKAEYTD